jgi:hypothetical protein
VSIHAKHARADRLRDKPRHTGMRDPSGLGHRNWGKMLSPLVQAPRPLFALDGTRTSRSRSDAGDWRRPKGRRVAVTIPAGDTVKLTPEPSPGNKMVGAPWKGRKVAMYAIDLKLRGIETPI